MMNFKNIENKYEGLRWFTFIIKVLVLGIVGIIATLFNNNITEAICGLIILVTIFNWTKIDYLIACIVTTDEEMDELLSYERGL